MKIKSKVLPTIVVMLLDLSLSGCMLMMAPMMATHGEQDKAQKKSDDTFWQKIKTADTPQKHLSIAKAYRRDAEDYRALAKEHQQRKTAYQSRQDKRNVSMEFMIIHCQRLVEDFNKSADEMESMAQKHEEMAKKVAEQKKDLVE